MNSTSCPRRFGWIETNWRRRIVEYCTTQRLWPMKFFSGIPEHVAFEAWSGFGFAFTDAGFSHVVR
jgi:hypothetical protein